MATFRSLASRFSALFRRRELDDRVDEELQFHLRMQTEENIRRGMDSPHARAAARRKLGNTTQVCEEVHRMNTISSVLDRGARGVVAVLLLAVLRPAARAARVDPMEGLRAD